MLSPPFTTRSLNVSRVKKGHAKQGAVRFVVTSCSMSRAITSLPNCEVKDSVNWTQLVLRWGVRESSTEPIRRDAHPETTCEEHTLQQRWVRRGVPEPAYLRHNNF